MAERVPQTLEVPAHVGFAEHCPLYGEHVIANHYVWAVHGALLITVGIEQTLQFWQRHPLELHGVRLSASELAVHLTQTQAYSPLTWVTRVTNDIEGFLRCRGVSHDSFLNATLRYSNGGSWVQSELILKWLAPLFVPLFRFGDPYRLVLWAAVLSGKQFAPGLECRVLRRRPKAVPDRESGALWATYPGLAERLMPGWDAENTTACQIQAGPAVFGLEPFEHRAICVDAREIEHIVAPAPCTHDASGLWVDGVLIAQRQHLGEFVESWGFVLPPHVPRDTQVFVACRDYVCPVLQRTVVRSGTAYAGPGYVMVFHWRPAAHVVRNFLAALVDGSKVLSAAEREVRVLHAAYNDRLTKTLHVVYHAADQSITVDGVHVCSSMPALILKWCLADHRAAGSREFLLRELRRDLLATTAGSAALELRLRRLASRLEQLQCGLLIHRERGKFTLECQHSISFVEQ